MDLTVIYLFLLYAVCVTAFIEENKIIHRVSETMPIIRGGLCNAFQLKAN